MFEQMLLTVALGASLALPAPAVEFHIRDTIGTFHTPAEWKDAKAILLLFITTDCPVGNSYVPEMNRIAEQYAARGVLTFAVFPNADVSFSAAVNYARDYQFRFPVLLDSDQDLVRLAGASVTPQAAILAQDGELMYRGRIDNRVENFGLQRQNATEHDVCDALDAILAGRHPRVQFTRSVGCAITLRNKN
jgi:thiol-disulfide isomerase/thioredoxin